MPRIDRRLAHAALLVAVLLSGSGCVPKGAIFSSTTGVLSIYGTEGPDTYVVSASANGSIVVNGGVVPIIGGVPTVANTVRIALYGRGGDDQLVVDPGGALPGARFQGDKGTDVLVGGSGADEFVWFPGDGADTVEGKGGSDVARFHGSDAGEAVDIAANGGRVSFFQYVDGSTNDLNDVETIEFLAAGGADAVVVGDLIGTDATQVRVDLAGGAGGGDGQPDTITLQGTAGSDTLAVTGEGGAVRVAGLPAGVLVSHPEAAGDRLVVNAVGGDDEIDATAPGTDGMELVVNGGLGLDTFLGGEGNERFSGGDGDDVAFMGPGDDTAVWNPGDDDDTIEGEAGFDTLRFNGANVAEVIEISANGERARFFRSIANVTADLDDVEAIDYLALGGADLVILRDLSATDLVLVNVALATLAGTGDAQPDTVVVEGTAADDVIGVAGDATGVSVLGLAANVNITGAEDPGDTLSIGTYAGDDAMDASGLATPSIQLYVEGGVDHDVLIGGDGVDVLMGGDGDDVLVGGPGLDALDGGPGDNVVIQ